MEWITGVVPDGNLTVSAVLAEGQIKTTRVIHNVFSIALRGRAIALKTNDAAGHQQTMSLW
jgi:hypothetical protein